MNCDVVCYATWYVAGCIFCVRWDYMSHQSAELGRDYFWCSLVIVGLSDHPLLFSSITQPSRMMVILMHSCTCHCWLHPCCGFLVAPTILQAYRGMSKGCPEHQPSQEKYSVACTHRHSEPWINIINHHEQLSTTINHYQPPLAIIKHCEPLSSLLAL